MASTQDLLGVIGALRQRLEQAQCLAEDAGAAVASVLDHAGPSRLPALRQFNAFGLVGQQKLQATLRAAAGIEPAPNPALPTHLSVRAARILEEARELLQRLKSVAADPLLTREHHPVAAYYEDTVLLTELVLRSVQSLPDAPDRQMRLSSGADVLLNTVRQRLGTLESVTQRRARDHSQLGRLADFLVALHRGRARDVAPLFSLADEVASDATTGQPLRLLPVPDPAAGDPDAGSAGADLVGLVSLHSLNTARLVAHLARDDDYWRGHALQAVAAALVHDAGMLTARSEVITHPRPLADEQRVAVERHCQAGANLLAPFGRLYPWLAETALQHHERGDGTGYPAGLREPQLAPLAQLVAVADVYTALSEARPHRPAGDAAAAFDEVQRLAGCGQLDAIYAGLVARLTPYPAGQAVELSDGSSGIVVWASPGGGQQGKPARPVVLLLADAQGQALPHPRCIDLSRGDDTQVTRCLSADERCGTFGPSHPQFVIP